MAKKTIDYDVMKKEGRSNGTDFRRDVFQTYSGVHQDIVTSVILEEHLTFLLMYLLNLSLSFHIDYNLGLRFIIHP